MATLTAAIGSDFQADIVLLDDLGQPVSYLSADTPSAQFWAGDSTANLFTPTVAWINPTAGSVRVSWLAAAVASITPGDYTLRVRVTTAATSVIIERWRGSVRLAAGPGSQTNPAAYHTYSDMLQWAPWLEDLASRSGRSGFALQRGEARVWMDRLIQRHYRAPSDVRDDSLDHIYDGLRRRRTGADDPTLQGYLDDDLLILTGPQGKAVIKACALYASALVAQAQIGAGDDSEVYQKRAVMLFGMADDAVATLTVLIDTDDDNVGDLAIDLSMVDVIRG
jgi:hypothetical protein